MSRRLTSGWSSRQPIAKSSSNRGSGARQSARASWDAEAAIAAWGRELAVFALGSNSRVRGSIAREQWGWKPRRSSVTGWIREELA